jgi:putative DNA primase/helicase
MTEAIPLEKARRLKQAADATRQAPNNAGRAVIPAYADDENDLGNAERLVLRCGDRLRFVRGWGWLAWNGKYWDLNPDEARRMAQATVKGIYAECGEIEDKDAKIRRFKFAKKSGDAPRITAMMKEAEALLVATPPDFDKDPFLLNCENGTLELRTSVLHEHRPGDLITRLCPVVYDAEALAPEWMAFLDRVVPDRDLLTFLGQFLGYTLTGDTSEQVLVFLHGSGANGKSTLVEVVWRILGTYATRLPFRSLLHNDRRGGGDASPDLARLPGVRAVAAAEPDVGSRFSESVVKELTGGDTIAARRLHQEFFDFTPEFTLWLVGNHKPKVLGTDEGIWRRVLLLPFEETIPAEERDKNLLEKLWAERSGILSFMVEGCRMWQRDGLQVPVRVRAATDEYRVESDDLADFLAEVTTAGPELKISVGHLHGAYLKWVKENGGRKLGRKLLSQMMDERGYSKYRPGCWWFKGLTLTDAWAEKVHTDSINE